MNALETTTVPRMEAFVKICRMGQSSYWVSNVFVPGTIAAVVSGFSTFRSIEMLVQAGNAKSWSMNAKQAKMIALQQVAPMFFIA